MSSTELAPHQLALIERAMAAGALKFGVFTLKSGRQSPYFINVGLLCTGAQLSALGAAYAAAIAAGLASGALPAFDVLFGPAYKGIPLAAVAAVALQAHGLDVGVAYDRKEAKAHGEGGSLVGAPVAGKKVLVLDDVMTAGTAARGALALIRAAGGEPVGAIMCLDREEVGADGVSSTARELEKELGGKGRVQAILRMRDLMSWLGAHGRSEELGAMKAYRAQYGVKDEA